MTTITASMVGELRARTDAPMMECKKALSEANGDMTRAEEILRVKLGNKANKAAGRITAEGVISITKNSRAAAIIEINCETDFVSKNDDFLNFCRQCVELVAEKNPEDVAELSKLALSGQTVESARTALIGKIGENLTIRRFNRIELTANNHVAHYLHGTRIGVLVAFEGENEQVGKDVAMHIAAMKPVALSEKEVDATLIEKERSIALQKASESGKPQEIINKMVEGSVQKFLKEVSLINQAFVKNDKQSISDMLREHKTVIKAFTLFVVGEGIEKRQDDFAAEVAAQVAAAKN